MDKLRRDIARIYFLLCNLRRISPQKVKAVRCHESAGIFCDVLRNLGYSVELVNGCYLLHDLSNGEGMQHSWVEMIIEPYGGMLLIETTPHVFFPELTFEELVDKMVIPPNDARKQRYIPLEDELFFRILEQLGIKSVDRLVIRYYSSLIIEKLKELSKKVNG